MRETLPEIFGQLFLTYLPATYASSQLKRLIKTPKLQFLDAGLLAALHDISPQQLAENRGPFDSIPGTFVLSEVLKLASWTDQPFVFSHYRDTDQNFCRLSRL